MNIAYILDASARVGYTPSLLACLPLCTDVLTSV
jgi:hypothetical protein